MKTDEILEEIHRVREEHARECGYDIEVIFAEMREDLKRLKAEGWKVGSPGPRVEVEEPLVLREEPPKKVSGE